MTEIDNATAAPPGGDERRPHLMSPPPKKLDADQRSQSQSSSSANEGGRGGTLSTTGAGAAPPSNASGAPGSSTGGSRKRRRHRPHRPNRNKRRKGYRPYHKLSYEEQRELDNKETVRAEQRRAAQFSHGRAMAPYNTTQFIMEDLEARNLEPDVGALVEKLNDRCGSRERTYSGTGSLDDSEEHNGSWASPSDDDESSFDLDAEFDEQYQSVHVQRLESLSKTELIEEVMSLEADVSRSQVETKELRQMVQRLRADNYTLRKTLREAGIAEARPNSAPPPAPQPPPSLAPATLDSALPPADPDHAADTDTSSSRPDEPQHS